MTKDGYLLHKYNPDGTVGSSWHPYLHDGQEQLPIQEDETALVLHALWQDYELHADIELPQSLYRAFIRKAARFLLEYCDDRLGLPAQAMICGKSGMASSPSPPPPCTED